MKPHTIEACALRQACFAVISTDDEIPDADLWALGTLALLNAFAARVARLIDVGDEAGT